MFGFFSGAPVRFEVACINVASTIIVVILLGQRVETFFNLTFARAHIHARDVDWARYQGRANCLWHGLVRGSIYSICNTVSSIFKFASYRYRIATPPLCWCCLPLRFETLTTAHIFHPLTITSFGRKVADRRCSVKTLTEKIYARQTLNIFPFLLWECIDVCLMRNGEPLRSGGVFQIESSPKFEELLYEKVLCKSPFHGSQNKMCKHDRLSNLPLFLLRRKIDFSRPSSKKSMNNSKGGVEKRARTIF